MRLEICIDSIESAMAAKAGGAHRLEICSALALGGTTPSYGLVQQCVDLGGIETAMMIRPRDGDFCYDDDELSVIQADIEIAKQLNADGIVFGALSPNHEIDIRTCQLVIEWARPMEVTFHRAFDVTNDPAWAIDQLLELGVDRLLTSGQAPTAPEGMELLSRLVRSAGEQLCVMAGSGINASNVAKLVQSTGVREIHGSASVVRSTDESPTGIQFAMTPRRVTSAAVVRDILTAAGIDRGD